MIKERAVEGACEAADSVRSSSEGSFSRFSGGPSVLLPDNPLPPQSPPQPQQAAASIEGGPAASPADQLIAGAEDKYYFDAFAVPAEEVCGGLSPTSASAVDRTPGDSNASPQKLLLTSVPRSAIVGTSPLRRDSWSGPVPQKDRSALSGRLLQVRTLIELEAQCERVRK